MLNDLGEVRAAAPLSDRMVAFISKRNFGKGIDQIFDSPPRERGNSYYGTSHLHQIYDFYANELRPAIINEFQHDLVSRPGHEVTHDGKELLIQPAIEWFMNALIDHKDKFQYVFKTERGSTYFVLPTGESLRFRMADPNIRQGLFAPVARRDRLEKPYMEIERVSEKCYFIDPKEDEMIKDERVKNIRKGFIYIDVQTQPFSEGMIPLELNPSYNHNLPGFMPIEVSPQGKVHIGQNVSWYHSGSRVTEVIKK